MWPVSYWTISKMLRSPASLLASHHLHSRQKQRGSGWKKKLVIATKKDWMVTTILQHVFSLVLFTATNIVDWMMMMIATTDMPMMTVAMVFIHDSFALCKIFVAGKQLKLLELHGFILLWTLQPQRSCCVLCQCCSREQAAIVNLIKYKRDWAHPVKPFTRHTHWDNRLW